MKKKNHNKILIIISVVFYIFLSCEKDDKSLKSELAFILSSPEIGADSLLPADYTCDGISATLPLRWSGAPDETVSFALVMHHVASPTDIHWYWVLYNIPASVNSLPENVTGIGTLGTNSVNDKTEYSPPCSQGPGIKAYAYTLYALSREPSISVPSDKVTMDVLLKCIEDIKLSSAKITVYYSRNI